MRISRIFLIIILSFILSLSRPLASRGVAQTQAGPAFRIAEVHDQDFPQVNIFAAVVDQLNRPIPNLTGANFSVVEDGKPINNFVVTTAVNDQQPLAISLAIDTGNADQTEFNNMIDATIPFVESLGDEDQLALVTFDEQVKVLQELETQKQAVPTMLKGLTPQGNSKVYDGLMMAIQTLKDAPLPRAVVAVTNGVDSLASVATPEQIIKAANANHVQIYILGFGGAVDQKKIDPLTQGTGGQSVYLPGYASQPEELADAFVNIQKLLDETLRYQYVLQYTSSLHQNGSIHQVGVAVNYQGWQASDSGDMIACPGDFKVCLPDYLPDHTVASNACLTPVMYPITPPVKQLDVLMDNKSVCSDASQPFECCLNPATTTEGSHNFKFTATDTGGATGQTSLSLMVRPLVKFDVKSPAENAIVTGEFDFNANLDALATLSKVQFKVADQMIKELTNLPAPSQGPPYIYNIQEKLNISSIPSGKQVLVVTAFDAKGTPVENRINLEVQNVVTGGVNLWPLAIVAVILLAAAALISIAARRRAKKGEGGESVSGGLILREMQGLYPNQIWPLDRAEIRLGRKAAENDIQLKGINASRKMAVIRFIEGNFYIYSLNPQNPALVNNAPVQQQRILQPGDLIQLGESLFRFEQGEKSE